MTSHALDALLTPRSIALVGASARPDSSGQALVAMSRIDGFSGAVYPVNPRYEEIDGLPCYPQLSDLPAVPDHVAIAVASPQVEAALDQAIALGIRSATIFAACHVEGDPDLAARLARKARKAGMAICGPNCMGFYSPAVGLRVASFPSPAGLRPGGIAWIAQSGSAFGALAHNDRRLGFNLCVSTGMEIAVTAANFIDWALARQETRVIGLFLESVRNPAAFSAALEKAAEQDIPVVILKVGRTARSAAMALSHTGAIAGSGIAFGAACRRYGVSVVGDMDEMAATLAMFDCGRRAHAGRLATVHDSGGERELVADIADDLGIDFAEINAATRKALARNLEPGLVAENPLDIFGTNNNYIERFSALTSDLVNDPDVALGLFMANPRDDYWYATGYVDAIIDAARNTSKPLALVANYSLSDERKLAARLVESGIALVRGTRNSLLASQHLMARRDFRRRTGAVKRLRASASARKWAKILSGANRLTEHEGLRMLADCGMQVPQLHVISSAAELDDAIAALGFPLVLKTAEDIEHKSDVHGVHLGLATAEAAHMAYDDLAVRLGPRALVMETVDGGVEIGLGALYDPDFGPLVVVSAGGVLIELLDDRAAALAPFDEATAEELIQSLRVSRLLRGFRNVQPADMAALCRQIAKFSRLVSGLGDSFSEIDVNPLIVTDRGTWAVDCLAFGKTVAG